MEKQLDQGETTWRTQREHIKRLGVERCRDRQISDIKETVKCVKRHISTQKRKQLFARCNNRIAVVFQECVNISAIYLFRNKMSYYMLKLWSMFF